MMRKFILSAEVNLQIKESELWERIRTYKERDSDEILNCGYIHLGVKDFQNFAEELKERGYFETLKWEVRKKYFGIMNSIIKQQVDQYWLINRNWTQNSIVSTLDDLLIFSWIYPAEIMNPDELWNNEKFGFSSVTDLISSVSVYMMNILHSHEVEWRDWLIQKGGNTYRTVISWDLNWDFCLFRDNITPYVTINPFWDRSSLRPESQDDKLWVFWYHSMEKPFLVSILRWIDQCNVKSQLLNSWMDGILGFLASVKKRSNMFAWFTEQAWNNLKISDWITSDDIIFDDFWSQWQDFIAYDMRLSNLWEDINPNFWIVTSSGLSKIAQIRWDNLVYTTFSNQNIDLSNQQVLCEFFPEEADEIIKGILVQCYSSLWRTGIAEILELFNFYFKNKKNLIDWTYRENRFQK